MFADPGVSYKRGADMTVAARRSLFLTLVAVSALDAWTTYVVLRAGQGRELNPVARAAIDTFGLAGPCAIRVVIGVAMAAFLLRLTVLADDRLQRVIVWTFCLSVAAWWTWIVVSNTRYL